MNHYSPYRKVLIIRMTESHKQKSKENIKSKGGCELT